jgi:hypothetical protein
VLAESGVKLDALVFSGADRLERAFAEALDPRPELLVATRGSAGGSYETAGAGGGVAAAPAGTDRGCLRLR